MWKTIFKSMSICAMAVGIAFIASGTIAKAASEAELRALAKDLPGVTKVRVLGIASGTSEWNFLHRPFWAEVVPDLSGGKIQPDVHSITELGVKGPETYRLVKIGVADIADIVANYGAGDVIQLDALDLAGVATDWESIMKALDVYIPVVAKLMEEKFGVLIHGYHPATAQVFWCREKVTKLSDIKGKKIRLTSATLADLVAGLGGTPVNMAFAEAPTALQRGVIDCIITGTASGNTAKLPEIGNYLFLLTAGWAPNIRIVNKKWFDSLDPKVQTWLKKASEYYIEHLALPTEKKNND